MKTLAQAIADYAEQRRARADQRPFQCCAHCAEQGPHLTDSHDHACPGGGCLQGNTRAGAETDEYGGDYRRTRAFLSAWWPWGRDR